MCANRSTCFLAQEDFDKMRAKYARFNEPWTTEEEEELQRMAEAGATREEMSRQLQRTPSAIRIKLKNNGLLAQRPMPKAWTDIDDATLVKMYNDEKSFEEMAEVFSRSERAVVARLVRLRVDLFPVQP